MNRLVFSIVIILVAVSCRIDSEVSEKRGPLHIVVTTGIIGDVLTEILADSAEVSSIMGPGTDPHIYRPTPGDIDMLDDADIIVANGLHLEGKMQEMLEKYSKEKPVFFVSDGLKDRRLIKSADFADSFDPHIWFDPDLWMDGIEYVINALSEIDTTCASYYADNFTDYKKEVMQTDKKIRRRINRIEKIKRVLITSHDAFSYFGRRYNIEVRGIQGISTMSEVGLRDISQMVDFVIEREIRSIFVETSTSDKTAQSIVDGCDSRGYDVQIKGPLFSDALGEPHTEGGTYLGMILENAKQIEEGLGWDGKSQ